MLQHLLGWQPCPLCIVQRLAVIATGVLALASALSPSRHLAAPVFRLGATAGALGGIAAAYEQLMLVWGPGEETCGPGLRMTLADLVERVPSLEWLLDGPADCAAEAASLFGMPLAFWTFGLLTVLLAVLWAPYRPRTIRA